MSRLKPIVFIICTTLLPGCSVFKSSKNAGYINQVDENNEASQQVQQQLNAAAALIESNEPNEAKLYTDAVNINLLSAADLSRLQLLQTQINLGFAETDQAVKHLRQVKPELLNHTDQITYLKTRAVVFSLLGKPIESAKARIKLQLLLNDAHEQFENKSAIIDTLRLLPAKSLQTGQPPAPDQLGGWMALARLIKISPQLADHDPNIMQWRTRFPKHPADSVFLQAYLITSQKSPSNIAIFLPESGAYAEAAKAIKAGFMAAYKQADNNSKKPGIRFYDSELNDPVSLYHQAIEDGAQLIIGPLDKTQVEQLAKVDLETPVLTLNHIPGLNKANLYQFALSPIDEVEQITNKAVDDGHKQVLLMTPKTELGKRVQGYFKTALEKRGGTLLKAKQYNPDISDYNDTLKDLLNISESDKRHAQLQAIIPNLKYTPTQRHDVDALLATAYPSNAATIQTQLNKLSPSNNIPIYATPQIFNGVTLPSDKDLNNITFCDIPWVFDAAYQGSLSLTALKNTWQPFQPIYLRLVAMGIDAYNLIPHLNQLKTVPYNGATGRLLLTDENRIQRHLVCAKFNHIQPELLDSYTQSTGNMNIHHD